MGDATRSAGALLVTVLLVGCSKGGQPSLGTADAGSMPPAVSAPAALSSQPSTATSEGPPMTDPAPSAASAAFTLTSTAFAEGGAIPTEFSCDGANVSPPLSWAGVPAGTAALVLVVDDPDARGFVHWIVLDLPGTDGGLPQGVSPTADSPQQGTTSFGKVGWGGPCPPSGTHHYRFTLTALAAPLGLPGHPAGSDVEAALGQANVLGKVVLTATYQRS
jgi:Raf kinase inhibitor-like YbhB/YbcL family protein